MSEFDTARTKMVDNQLRTSTITDQDILAVMGEVPRELFVSPDRQAIAYADIEHAYVSGQGGLATPASFARLIQLAEISRKDVVLDLGCGTGYSTAVLAKLADAVVAVDESEALIAQADSTLSRLDIGNAAVLSGSVADGMPKEAPFDVIVLEGAVDAVPPALFKQLREGGRLVAAIRKGRTGVATVFVKSEGDVSAREAFDLGLPPMMLAAPKAEFVF